MWLHLVVCWLAALLLGDNYCSAVETNDVKQLLGGSRNRRSLLYSKPGDSETKVQVLFGLGLPMEGEVSMTLGYVIKCNYNLPYNTSHFTGIADQEQRQQFSQGSYESGSRWSLYRILETALGKSCLLRTVCEAALLPLASRHADLLASLLQLMLTPSATQEDYEIYADQEYHAAEVKGRRERDCSCFYDDCPYSPLDYFTRILAE